MSSLDLSKVVYDSRLGAFQNYGEQSVTLSVPADTIPAPTGTIKVYSTTVPLESDSIVNTRLSYSGDNRWYASLVGLWVGNPAGSVVFAMVETEGSNLKVTAVTYNNFASATLNMPAYQINVVARLFRTPFTQ